VLTDDVFLHVKIRNINFQATEKEFVEFLKSRGVEWIVHEFGRSRKLPNSHNGSCRLKVENKLKAKGFAALNYENFQKRKLQVEIEVPPDVEEEESADTFVKREPVISAPDIPQSHEKLDKFLS